MFFPDFMLSYLDRAIVLKLLCFGKELEVQEMIGRLLHVGQVLSRDKGFLVAT